MNMLCSKAVESAVKIEGDDASLFAHTQLKPLHESRELDRISFSRSRLVALDWGKIIGKQDAGKPLTYGSGAEFLRRAVEKSWGRPESTNPPDLGFVNERFESAKDFVLRFKADDLQTFLVTVDAEFTITPDIASGTFNDFPSYVQMWNYVKCVSYEVAGDKPTEMSEVSLAPSLIHRQYREFAALRSLATEMDKNADVIASREFKEFATNEDIEQTIAGYLRMKSLRIELEQKLERLRNKARDLGFHLSVTPTGENYKTPAGADVVLKAGELYRPYSMLYRWTTTEVRREWREVHVGRTPFGVAIDMMMPVDVSYAVEHEQVAQAHELVTPDYDPWVEKESELRKEGFKVFRFERRDMRYIAITGESLESILERCQSSPAYREKCAVMLPIYEQTLIKSETLVKYLVFKRPRPGSSPLHAPRVYIEENLQLSTHFQGVEVGELAHTINLAPGERRELVIEKATNTQFETRRTATSIMDLTETDRIDLSTEMEKEASNSTESSRTQSLSAKAGGSYGGFSASVDGSSTETMTAKQFARDLQKLANKASRSVTKQTRQEVRTETSLQSSASRKESSKIAIANINDGRSLNLAFYHLYNIYSLKLRLENLSFTYLSGLEAIAGSGLVLPEAYPVSRLSEMLQRISIDHLPVVATTSDAAASAALYDFVLSAIEGSLKEEYFQENSNSDNPIKPPIKWAAQVGASTQKRVEALTLALESARYNPDTNLMPTDEASRSLVIGSPGLYLDSFVGSRPSTEPYSENMRNAEWAKRLADVRETEARAFQMESLARRSLLVDAGNTVRAEAQSLKILRLIFSSPPLQGVWSLISASQTLETITVTNDKLEHEFTFTTDQKWLSADTLDLVRMVHNETKRTMGFTV